MPRRPTRSRRPAAPPPIAALAALGRRTLVALRDLAFGLALVSAVSYLPGSVTDGWSPHAQRALTIARDIRALLHDLAWDSAAGVGRETVARDDPPAADRRAPAASPTPTSPAPADRLPHVAASFAAAKRLLYDRVYADHRRTFYCGCDYDPQRQVDLGTCRLGALSGNSRSARVEAEHIFPAAQFGQSRPCWRAPAAFPQCAPSGGPRLSGRACCERVDPTFETAHNDLHNLVPAVGAINGQRSDFNWGMVSGGTGFGACAIRIDPGTRRVQPPPGVRGDIARTMQYMSATYGFRLSRQDRQLYAAWSAADAPDAWEIERDRRIEGLQGRGNRFVEDYGRP